MTKPFRKTLANRMVGATSGFDYLRLGLAVAVVAWHSLEVTAPLVATVDAQEAALVRAWADLRAPLGMILPMFFSLSGFLVAGSLKRNRLDGFVALRALRIAPALAMEVLLSALVLGPLVTSLPLDAYFTHPTFWRYLQNLFGHVQFALPGVFAGHPVDNVVNVSLWTVPFELYSYLALLALAVLSFHHRRRLFLAVTLVAAVLVPILDWESTFFATRNLSGWMLVVSFLAGACLYLYRDRVPDSGAWLVVAALLCVLLFSTPVLDVFGVLPAAYVTVWLGLRNPPKIPVLLSGDYSYGIYLFAFPVQQALWTTPIGKTWAGNFGLALLLSGCYGVYSWHCIERPVLSRKKQAVEFVMAITDHFRRAVAIQAAPITPASGVTCSRAAPSRTGTP